MLPAVRPGSRPPRRARIAAGKRRSIRAVYSGPILAARSKLTAHLEVYVALRHEHTYERWPDDGPVAVRLPRFESRNASRSAGGDERRQGSS